MIANPRMGKSYMTLLEVSKRLQLGTKKVTIATSDPSRTATAMCNLLPGVLCEVLPKGGIVCWRPRYLEHGYEED